jgi:hypothetical protein
LLFAKKKKMFALEVPAAARLNWRRFDSGKLKSGKFDPAPKPPRLLTRVNSGRSALYETTFEHPAEPDRLQPLYARWQVETDSFSSVWTLPYAEALPFIFIQYDI